MSFGWSPYALQDLSKAFLTVGESKTKVGESRTIPLKSALLGAIVEYSKWYTRRFGTIQPDWYVFAFGKPWPKDPTRPMVTLKTSWRNVKTKGEGEGAVARQPAHPDYRSCRERRG